MITLLVIIIFFGCNTEKQSNTDNFICETRDTIIHGVNISIVPTLIDSFVTESNHYKIYANYAILVEDSFYFNKTFESLIVLKNEKFLKSYFKTKISEQLSIENQPYGFKNGSTVELIEIKNLKHKTFSVVFKPNMSAPSFQKYAFLEFNKSIAVSDTIFGMSSRGFNQNSIKASQNSFEVTIFNHLFNVNVPICLKRINDTILTPFIDTSKATLDGNFIVYNVDISKDFDYSKSNDTISLYANYNSNEIELLPLSSLKDVKFYKAARYYEFLDINNFYKIIRDTEFGMRMSKEDYKKNNYNYDTKWLLYIETENFKGWIRKKKDYNKLGFYEAG